MTRVGRFTPLEAKQRAIQVRLAKAPADVPDLHPNIAKFYRRKVERLSEVLDHQGAVTRRSTPSVNSAAHVVLTPGANRGDVYAKLHGDIVAIADWVSQGRSGFAEPITSLIALRARVSERVKARA